LTLVHVEEGGTNTTGWHIIWMSRGNGTMGALTAKLMGWVAGVEYLIST